MAVVNRPNLAIVTPSGASTTKRRDAYELDPSFLDAVAYLCCASPRFWAQIGREIDAELVPDDTARLVIATCGRLARDLGRGPDSPVLVLQQIRAGVSTGKIAHNDLVAASELLDRVEDVGVPAEDGVIAMLAPVLRRKMEADALQQMIEAYGKRADLTEVMELVAKSQRLGKVDLDTGTRLGMGSFAEIAKIRQMERLTTGVIDLDIPLDGGLGRGSLGVAVGGPGDGKSMFLSHVAAEALCHGLHVVYATLELPEAVVLGRLKANLTGCSISEIMDGRHDRAAQRLEGMLPYLGAFTTKYMTPGATTVTDLRIWVERCEEAAQRPVDLLVVDYADKLGAPKEQNEYNAMKIVYEGLRHFAVERGLWAWTASQATRAAAKDRAEGSRKLDLNHMADSMHKGRVADLVVSLNARDEGQQMEFYVAKNRIGRSRVTVGPLPCDFGTGRISPVNR
jgi:KaiC/GvpD/RAD55 family RecA-like ATPase